MKVLTGYFRIVKDAVLRRKEILSRDNALQTNLRRCLSLLDVVFIGLGHSIGGGLYVVTGQVARDIAGPAAILSFAIGAVVAVIISLCYAEFSSRIPRAGSAYIYAYITIGEIWAFLVGWNVILENILGLSSVSKAWSSYVDSITDSALSEYLTKTFGFKDLGVFSNYPDLVAVSLILFLMTLLCFGLKNSTLFNNTLTIVNLAVILIITVVGALYANTENWTNKENGGFVPYGFNGILTGAGIALYGYLGFEVIASAAEEMPDPCRMLPKGLIIVVIVATACYMSVSATLTLILPYWQLSESAPIVNAFITIDVHWVRYIISAGALSAMIASCFGSLYGTSRIVYSMSMDGMFPKCFGAVNEKTNVPVMSVVISGIVCSIVACFIELRVLVELFSIGCLFAFTVVSACVIILRYTPSYKIYIPPMYEDNVVCLSNRPRGSFTTENNNAVCTTENVDEVSSVREMDEDERSLRDLRDVIEGTGRLKLTYIKLNDTWPFNQEPGYLITIAVFVIVTLSFLIGIVIKFTFVSFLSGHWLPVTTVVVLVGILILNFVVICMHQQNQQKDYFRMPAVPLLPGVSIVLNVILMVSLNMYTWIRFVAWIAVGLVLYFSYGVRHSTSKLTAETDDDQPQTQHGSTSRIVRRLWGSLKDGTSRVNYGGIESEKLTTETTKENFPQ
ncbi:Uncharacterised protein g4435 [Pycnogonum litorale]